MKNVFLKDRFFSAVTFAIVLFLISYLIKEVYYVGIVYIALLIAAVIFDYYSLFKKSIRLRCRRILPKVFSLGDENPINIEIQNLSKTNLNIEVIDEIPFDFQNRDFSLNFELGGEQRKKVLYKLRPVTRGEYAFGKIRVFISSGLGLLNRRINFDRETNVPVFPSIIQMKQYSLKAFDRNTPTAGLKLMRRIGHSYEFEQIKNYVPGDDPRSINWKASSRRAQLMVNQYEEERAQNIYSVIDKSRAMRMPFDGLSLMDYAINTSLAISNVALQKHDRAGLLTFSDKVGVSIKADRRANQLNKILNALYKEKEQPLEANFELFYQSTRKLIKGRSLLMLYTNFESIYALDRVLPILRKVNTLHLLVVVIFKNTEVSDFVKIDAENTEDIYHNTIARQFVSDKVSMVRKLKQYGIQAILTRPEDLSLNAINKYLELKARGLI